MNELNKILMDIGDLQADIIDNIKPHIDPITFKQIHNQLNELKNIIYSINITGISKESKSDPIEIIHISDACHDVLDNMLDDIKLHSHLMSKQQLNIAEKTLYNLKLEIKSE